MQHFAQEYGIAVPRGGGKKPYSARAGRSKPVTSAPQASENFYALPQKCEVFWVLNKTDLQWLHTSLQLGAASPGVSLVAGVDLEWPLKVGSVRHYKCSLLQIAVVDKAASLAVFEGRQQTQAPFHRFDASAQRPASLDFASTKVFLVDLMSVPPEDVVPFMAACFGAAHITKLGFSFTSDLGEIARTFPALRNLQIAPALVDINRIRIPRPGSGDGNDNGGESSSSGSSNNENNQTSLARVVQWGLNMHLDKRQTKSDWSRRPLLRAQEYYAACDAACLVEIYFKCRDAVSASLAPAATASN